MEGRLSATEKLERDVANLAEIYAKETDIYRKNTPTTVCNSAAAKVALASSRGGEDGEEQLGDLLVGKVKEANP